MNLRLEYYRFKLRLLPFLTQDGEFNYILEKSGIKVGEGTVFYGPHTIQIDRSRPYLLEIGSYCKITSGVIILTHDYSRSVLRRVYGEILGEGRKTIIGDNVFVGMNSIILKGSHIGNNVIIGAGSIVSGNIPDNVVIAGNPAKIVRTLEDHYRIKKESVLSEAKECVKAFYERYNRIPTIKETDPFWPLYMERDENTVIHSGVCVHLSGDNYDETIRDYLNSNPIFNNYQEFIHYCLGEVDI